MYFDQPKCDVYETWRTINVGNTKIRGLEVEWDYKPWLVVKWVVLSHCWTPRFMTTVPTSDDYNLRRPR